MGAKSSVGTVVGCVPRVDIVPYVELAVGDLSGRHELPEPASVLIHQRGSPFFVLIRFPGHVYIYRLVIFLYDIPRLYPDSHSTRRSQLEPGYLCAYDSDRVFHRRAE